MKTVLPLLSLLALALGCAQPGESALDPASATDSPLARGQETPDATASAETEPDEASAVTEAPAPARQSEAAPAAESAPPRAPAREILVRTVESLEEGRKVARAEGKTIVLKFEADWCAPCNLMAREGFVDPEVAERLKDTVVVKVNIDDEKNKALAQKYEVASVPFLVFLDKDEMPFEAIKGYEDVAWFRARLAKALGKRRV